MQGKRGAPLPLLHSAVFLGEPVAFSQPHSLPTERRRQIQCSPPLAPGCTAVGSPLGHLLTRTGEPSSQHAPLAQLSHQ